jgi:hypothetical protein
VYSNCVSGFEERHQSLVPIILPSVQVKLNEKTTELRKSFVPSLKDKFQSR